MSEEGLVVLIVFVVTSLICIGVFFGSLICPKLNAPMAIEVYQGKTTLEYKVVDGEIVDSCVVYKKK